MKSINKSINRLGFKWKFNETNTITFILLLILRICKTKKFIDCLLAHNIRTFQYKLLAACYKLCKIIFNSLLIRFDPNQNLPKASTTETMKNLYQRICKQVSKTGLPSSYKNIVNKKNTKSPHSQAYYIHTSIDFISIYGIVTTLFSVVSINESPFGWKCALYNFNVIS